MLSFQYIPNPCPLCGEETGRSHHAASFPQGEVHWVQCPADGLIYQNPRLDDPSLLRLFDSDDYREARRSRRSLGYYSYFEGENARLATGRHKSIDIEKRLGRGPLDILEIGCPTGSFLKACADRGHRVQGIDASSAFARYGQQNYGLDIQVGLFENFRFPESSFDVVAIFGSLVCLSNPLGIFSAIRSMLKPNGLLVFNVPVLDGLIARLYGKRLWVYRPSAQVIYTRGSVIGLLKRAGYSLMESKRDVQAVSIEKLASVSGLPLLGTLFGPLRKRYLTVPLPSVLEFKASVSKTEGLA